MTSRLRGEVVVVRRAVLDWHQWASLGSPRIAEMLRPSSTDERLSPEVIAAEQLRIGARCWSLVQGSDDLRLTLSNTEPELYARVLERSVTGWSGKRLRQAGRPLYNIVARAATKCTPRGMLTRVEVDCAIERPTVFVVESIY